MPQVSRILGGALDGYWVDLCVDDPAACEADVFRPYRTENEGEVDYTLELTEDSWGRSSRVRSQPPVESH